MIKIKIRDLPGTIDRYTVMISDGKETHFYGMSETAEGFNQYCGSSIDGYKDGKHLGKVVDFYDLNESLQKAIKNRI